MAEYLERKTAVMRLMQDECSAKNVQSIMELPAADVAPVWHGWWADKQGGFWETATCSICGEKYPTVGIVPNYCPNCGAKMDGAE